MRNSDSFTFSVVLCGFVALASGAERLAAAGEPGPGNVAAAIAAVRTVGHEGAGNEEASAGSAILARTGAGHLVEILTGMDGAGPLATNYLRAAVDAVAERTLAQGDTLPTERLEEFVLDRRHSARPRRLAYEWLVHVDPATPARLLPGMLDDPSLELRRDAVAKVLAAADHAKGPTAQRRYQVALNAARDLDQIGAAADALTRFGVTTDLATHLGYIVDWHLIGPFDNTDQKGFQVPYPPESKVDFDTDYDGKLGRVRWQHYHTEATSGVVDLNKALSKYKGAIVYAAALFVADRARTAELRLGCINACKVWLNGKLAGAYETYHTAMTPDQYVGTVQLKRGTNVILVKICQNEQEESWAQRWEFQLRVTDQLGTALHSDVKPLTTERVLCQTMLLGFDVKPCDGEIVADRSAISAFGSRSESRQSGMITLVSKVDKAPLESGADWRQFRGPNARGVAASPSLPVTWHDGENGAAENIAWKIDLPGRGPSSPIVVAGRVVVTCSSGAKQDRLHVLCLDAATGQRLWQRQFWALGRTLCHPTSANAAPTPTSDGQRIFAFYSSNDLVCLDLDGNLLWYRALAADYPHAGNDAGMASSPLVIGTTVVVQVENQGDSFAAGIDVETGRNRWRLARQRDASWASPTPLAATATQRSLALLQSPSGLTAVDPLTGIPAWRLDATCEGIPSPVAADGVVYVPAGGITALRPPREPGRLKPEVLWQQNRLQPGPASPIIYQGNIYIINSSGVLSCGAATTGKLKWRLRLKGQCWATPVAVGNRLYAINSDGLAQVVQLGRKGRVIGTSNFGAVIQGSPAVVDNAMFVRSDRHLWKIAARPPKKE